MYAMKAYKGSGSIASLILNLGNRCSRVVSLMPHVFYPWGKSPVPSEWEANLYSIFCYIKDD
jgi:hypothetical protein